MGDHHLPDHLQSFLLRPDRRGCRSLVSRTQPRIQGCQSRGGFFPYAEEGSPRDLEGTRPLWADPVPMCLWLVSKWLRTRLVHRWIFRKYGPWAGARGGRREHLYKRIVPLGDVKDPQPHPTRPAFHRIEWRRSPPRPRTPSGATPPRKSVCGWSPPRAVTAAQAKSGALRGASPPTTRI